MPLHSKLQSTSRLIINSSEQSADLFWATRFLVPDPVVFIEHGGKRHLILNDLEFDRGKKEAQVDHVWHQAELEKKIRRRGKAQKTNLAEVSAVLLRLLGVSQVTVPAQFPLLQAQRLRALRVKVIPKPDPFYEARVIKTAHEKTAIRRSLQATSQAIQEAYRILAAANIRGNRLEYEGEPLTSERLRRFIDLHLLSHDCVGQHTIVAGGPQGVDPHCRGSGPLRPHQLIILDVFPKSSRTQYYGDMTRTVVKGRASDDMKKLWRTVKKAQEAAIKKIEAGIDGQQVHRWIHQYFETQGYRSGLNNGRMQGFFHSTGHGLGLDVHEDPRISHRSEILQSGMVVTVEPGLYYRETGGVRIEDVVYVKKGGCEVLSSCPKILEIE